MRESDIFIVPSTMPPNFKCRIYTEILGVPLKEALKILKLGTRLGYEIANGNGQQGGNLEFAWSLLGDPQISSVGPTLEFGGSLWREP